MLLSLKGSGLTIPTKPGVYLRETTLPQWRRPLVVLAQNPLTAAPHRYVRRLNRAAGATIATRAKTEAMIAVARFNMRRARKVVVYSQAMADYVAAAVPRAANRLQVCPATLPLDVLDHIRGGALTDVAHSDREATAALMGSVSPHKDMETAVRALAAAAGRIDIRSATVFGAMDHPHLARRLEALAGELGLELQFAVRGRVELLDIAARARVVVISSALESLGYALPEACVATSAVAAASVPSHHEVAARIGADIEWYPPGDVAAAVEAIVKAADRRDSPVRVVPDVLASEWRAMAQALDGTG